MQDQVLLVESRLEEGEVELSVEIKGKKAVATTSTTLEITLDDGAGLPRPLAAGRQDWSGRLGREVRAGALDRNGKERIRLPAAIYRAGGVAFQVRANETTTVRLP